MIADRDRPEQITICCAGHVCPVDDQGSQDWAYDYNRQCRRSLTYLARRGLKVRRCRLPVQLARDAPALYAAFLLGGEPAVVAAQASEDGQTQQGQGQGF